GAELDEVVNSISSLLPFVRSDENARGARGLPERRHFKFFYSSAVTGKEEYVLLDVVQEDDCRLECVEKSISTDFIQVDKDVTVRLPSVEALLGDKLTAFAPHTLGVPFKTKKGNSMTMQVVKQLFDVGELFNEVVDLAAVKRAYLESYRIESEYREGSFSMEETLSDTRYAALQLCVNGTKGGSPDAAVVIPMLDGIKRLGSHLVRDRFGLNLEVKVAAAKAHLLTSYLEGAINLSEDQLSFNLSERLDIIRDASIAELPCLDRLKKTVPEAFYYLALSMGAQS
ncbi:MAG: nucleotidyl transferase AbiEii/AbiGii toxin family protein, partial [Verrucomicrobia bacterium]|nr:nucleotidyl transferase AbiEii/AbiGii toxin family protein [Verrucomicrobiota bacterium]